MISDNNHITYSAEDIQRYWNGQLTSEEMHAMEKAALDDPFLADAMEGIGAALQEHDENMVNAALGDMRRQLETRTGRQTQTAPVRSFRWWQVAAAALVLVVAGYWIFFMKNEDTAGEVVAKQESTTAKDTKAVSPNTSIAPAPADSPATAPQAARANTDSTVTNALTTPSNLVRSNEPGLHEFKTETRKNNKDSIYSSSFANNEARNQANMPLPPPDLKNQKRDTPVNLRRAPAMNFSSDSVFKGRTEVVTVQKDFANLEALSEKKAEEGPKLQNVVSGVVTDSRNNPLPNVFIRLDGKSNFYNNDLVSTYTTDRLGKFKIPINDSVVNVSVSLPGYNTQNFRLRSTHDGAGIASNQLRLLPADEQILTQGYMNSKASAKKAAGNDDKERAEQIVKITEQDAQPVYGWLTYEQYLEKNKRIPDSNPNLIGEVAVSFVVNKKGETNDFRIEKSLSPDHDAEAIRLVRVGPAWKLLKGRKSRVTVIVRF